jgi:hypothetical protein
MGTKYRNLYDKKVKGAVPVNEEEEELFELAMKEQQEADIDGAIQALLHLQKKSPGRPRTTARDIELVAELLNKHQYDTKLAQQEFLNIVCERDGIKNKSGSHRFRTAFGAFKSRNT